MEVFTKTVLAPEKPITVKAFLLSCGFSSTLIKRIKYGGIFVNGESVNVNKAVENGDTVRVLFPEEASKGIEQISIPLNIVYEDEFILLVDKPKNMPTHPSRGNNLPTLANAVMAKFEGNFVFRAINRLDRDTSGLVLIAKDRISAYALSESMKAGLFSKEYICLVDGIPSPKEGRIDAPIKRESESCIKRIVSADGKRAITDYKVIEERDGSAVCELTLYTGRTHQIRVHMAHIGHPLAGDFLYGIRDEKKYFLRCKKLSFPHPKTKEIVTFEI